MSNNTSRRITVLGASESGLGAALLAKKEGYQVLVSDQQTIADDAKQLLSQHEIDFEEENHSEDFILGATEIIKSPEIPRDYPLLEKAKKSKISIISEVEFANRYNDAKIIAVTGTNGKTTTTLLIYHLLEAAGLNVGCAGMRGHSWAAQIADDKKPDYWVLEVNSYQLEYCFEFTPNIAIILNIMPDHLDRYDNNFQTYINTKFRLVQNQNKDHSFIYFKDNPAINREVRKRVLHPHLLPITVSDTVDNGAYMRDGELDFTIKKERQSFFIKQEDLSLKGKHNMINVMAAVLASLRLGLSEEVLKNYFKTFTGVEHRLEEVAEIAGIKFVNDSKATSIDSTFYALDSFDEKIVWIAGGIDPGNNYQRVMDLVQQRVKYLICVGKNNERLFETFKDTIRIIYQTTNMRDAVEQAFELARTGDIILLSPACGGDDLFKNYEDRGNQFKKIVDRISRTANLKNKR